MCLWRPHLHVKLLCFSMNDNDSVAEMLIDSLGTAIVNDTDCKGR